MHNIGNDIVDLNLAKTQSNWQRKGFLEKQFTKFEVDEILNSKNSFLKVWLFWSMKEAAYKCYTQEFENRFFTPKKFECKIVSNQKGIVQIASKKYHTKHFISNNYIHTIAIDNKDVKMVSDFFLINRNEKVTKKINTKLLSFFAKGTQLQKSDLGIPYLYQNNTKLPVSISKSHHGNYGAFAFTLNN